MTSLQRGISLAGHLEEAGNQEGRKRKKGWREEDEEDMVNSVCVCVLILKPSHSSDDSVSVRRKLWTQ